MAPLSEMYGRAWVSKLRIWQRQFSKFHSAQILHIGNIFTLFFSLGCAYSPTTGSLIAFRFLSAYTIFYIPILSSLTSMHQLGFREVLQSPLEEAQSAISSPKEIVHQQWQFTPWGLSSVRYICIQL